MRLTRESEYALLGLAHLAVHADGRALPLAEIATAESLPVTFLAKIFQKLVRHGVLQSERGRESGYSLSRSSSELTIREIFEAVEGTQIHERCLLWPGHCNDHDPCPLHYRLRDLGPAIDSILSNITLADYVAEAPRASHHRDAPTVAAHEDEELDA